jgi:hypothetical protein
MRWIVIRRRSANRLACTFRDEATAREAMRRWHAEGFAMELIEPSAPPPEPGLSPQGEECQLVGAA